MIVYKAGMKTVNEPVLQRQWKDDGYWLSGRNLQTEELVGGRSAVVEEAEQGR